MVKVPDTSFNSKCDQAMLKKFESLSVWTPTYIPQERNGEASGKTGKCMGSWLQWTNKWKTVGKRSPR